MRIKAKITAKGQTTMPVEVREMLKLKNGDHFEYVLENGRIYISPRNIKAVDLAGILGLPPRNAGSTREELDEAIGFALAEDDKRISDDWIGHQRLDKVSHSG
jgi:antitoxin PrlF